MKPRTIIGLVFIAASLTKLATIWGWIKWSWFEEYLKNHGSPISVSLC